MASPWKLLARLVSPRREQKEQDGATDDVTPEVLISSEPIETAADEGLDTTERLAVEQPQPRDHIDAILENTGDTQETGSSVQATVGTESAAGIESVQVALSDDADIGGRDASKPSRTSEDTPRRRSRRGKKAEAVEAVPQPSPVVATHSDDAISLDDEISVLRGQMITKLQLQNAQLKRMLERFER